MKAMNGLGGQSTFISDCIWEYESGDIGQGYPQRDDMRTVGKTFYTSSYICPKCGRFMLKANAGEYVGINTTQGMHLLKSVFACDSCKAMYSALPRMRLSQGCYYVMRDSSKYKKCVEAIDTYGISAGMF